MPTVFIVIQQSDNAGRAPGSRDDLVLNVPIVLTNSNDTGVTAWAWQLVDRPETSNATLSTPLQSVSGFTPDVEGTYLIRLSINNGAMSALTGAAIKTANLHYRIPAATEEDEFDMTRGWGTAVNRALVILDDAYGNLSAGEVSGGGGDGYLAFWNSAQSLTGNSHLTYNDTYFTAGESSHHITSIFYGSVGILSNIDTFGPSGMLIGTNSATSVIVAQSGVGTHIQGMAFIDGYAFIKGNVQVQNSGLYVLSTGNNDGTFVDFAPGSPADVLTFDGYNWAAAALPAASLQTAYNNGSTILLTEGEGLIPVVLNSPIDDSQSQMLIINDNVSNTIFSVSNSGTGGLNPIGTTFAKKLHVGSGGADVDGYIGIPSGDNNGAIYFNTTADSNWRQGINLPGPFDITIDPEWNPDAYGAYTKYNIGNMLTNTPGNTIDILIGSGLHDGFTIGNVDGYSLLELNRDGTLYVGKFGNDGNIDVLDNFNATNLVLGANNAAAVVINTAHLHHVTTADNRIEFQPDLSPSISTTSAGTFTFGGHITTVNFGVPIILLGGDGNINAPNNNLNLGTVDTSTVNIGRPNITTYMYGSVLSLAEGSFDYFAVKDNGVDNNNVPLFAALAANNSQYFAVTQAVTRVNNAFTINGVQIDPSAPTPSNGQVLAYNGSAFVPANPGISGSIADTQIAYGSGTSITGSSNLTYGGNNIRLVSGNIGIDEGHYINFFGTDIFWQMGRDISSGAFPYTKTLSYGDSTLDILLPGDHGGFTIGAGSESMTSAFEVRDDGQVYISSKLGIGTAPSYGLDVNGGAVVRSPDTNSYVAVQNTGASLVASTSQVSVTSTTATIDSATINIGNATSNTTIGVFGTTARLSASPNVIGMISADGLEGVSVTTGSAVSIFSPYGVLVDGYIAPVQNVTYNFGDSTKQWKDGYFGGSLVLDGYKINASGALTGQAFVYNGTAFVPQTANVNNANNASDVLVTTTSPTVALQLALHAAGNFRISGFFRVVAASTNVTIDLHYTDGGGSVQTLNLLPLTLEAVGNYVIPSILINCNTATIDVTITCGTANQVYFSGAIEALS